MDIGQLIQQAYASQGNISKAMTQPTSATTGLQAYNLEPAAKRTYPVLTPMRNKIPRRTGGYAIQANWKAITGVNPNRVRAGVSEGNRGGVIGHTEVEKLAAFKGYGTENFHTFEAEYAAKGFHNIPAETVRQTMEATMIAEEGLMLGGNNSLALGTTPTPALVAAAGGSLPNSALSVICVALGYESYWDLMGFNNGGVGKSLDIANASVQTVITRTNADGSTDTFNAGSAQKSAAASVTPSANGKVTASLVNAVRGAYGYAWYWGASGSEVLGAVTDTTTVVISAAATGSQTAASLPAADHSRSALEFDGLLTQIVTPGSGGYYYDAQAASLTSDGAGGIEELTEAFRAFYNLYRLSPDELFVNADDLRSMNQLIVGNSGQPILSLNVDINATREIAAGVSIGTYLNPYVGKRVKVVVHPNMPRGTMLFYSNSLPGYVQGVQQLTRMYMRSDYTQINWPVTTRKRYYGVYADGVLQCYFPPAFGVITNVGAAA